MWILAHKRLGDRRQMEELASALGWRTTVKRLAFRPPNIPFLARVLFDSKRSDFIGPPWPDLVLCAEALTSVIARLIGRRSKGAAKVVCLGRPAGTPERFDLVLTTRQYRLPKMPQVVELALPLAADPAEAPVTRDRTHLPDLGHAARPFTAALVGGTSLPELLDEAAATDLVRALLHHARKSGGTLMLITSPRTGRAAAALARAVAAPHLIHIWRATGDNPYRQFLGLADHIIVTSDSPSMTADALATGKPVSIYQLPQRWTLPNRIVEWLYGLTWGRADGSASAFWLRPVKWLFDNGIIEALPDRRRFFDRLAAEGRLTWFGERAGPAGNLRPAIAEREAAADYVLRLFSLGVDNAPRRGYPPEIN